jgi:hypothetical protein
MTLQFRSRIKSTFDYGSELKQVGKCCFSSGTSEEITFLECFSREGTFFANKDTPCPTEAEKGYCCSCTYLSTLQKQQVMNNLPYSESKPYFQANFGIRDNITKCECDRIGGNWSKTASDYNICKKEVIIDGLNKTIDVRIPNACCSFLVEEGQPIGVTCQNVCNQRECANLALIESGSPDPYTDTTFNQYKACGKEIVSGITGIDCGTTTITSRLISNTSAFAGEPMGPCYVLNEETLEYDCSVEPEFLCSGYWVNPSSIDSDVAYCNHDFAPKNPTKTFSYVNPTEYSQTEFNNLGLSIGDEFQGGIYIGTFVPKKTNATGFSQVYGQLNFSTPETTYHTVSDESPYKKWAIIVNKTFLNTYLISRTDNIIDYTSSYYDGYLNCYGNPESYSAIDAKTIKSIAGKLRNGFIDYYVPSIVEMMFFAQQYKTNTLLQSSLDLNGVFCSSTFLTDRYLTSFSTGKNTFSNLNFLYGQNFLLGNNFGKTVALNIHKNVDFMLFRRIIIS